jgi:hypothetical protein
MVHKAAIPALLDLSDLERNPPPAIGARRAPGFVEAAALCLESQGHSPGVALDVRDGDVRDGKEDSGVSLRWSLRTDAERSWDEIESTADGAVAVGLSLLRHTMKLDALDRGRIPSGFDYWLGTADGAYRAVVEISGIRRGTRAQVAARLREKKAQIRDSNGLTAYALVVEFGHPSADVGVR